MYVIKKSQLSCLDYSKCSTYCNEMQAVYQTNKTMIISGYSGIELESK